MRLEACVRVVISENEPFLSYCYDYPPIYEARFFSFKYSSSHRPACTLKEKLKPQWIFFNYITRKWLKTWSDISLKTDFAQIKRVLCISLSNIFLYSVPVGQCKASQLRKLYIFQNMHGRNCLQRPCLVILAIFIKSNLKCQSLKISRQVLRVQELYAELELYAAWMHYSDYYTNFVKL